MTTVLSEPSVDTIDETESDATTLGGIAREGLKGLFKAQGIILDFAAEQNAIAFEMVRKRLKTEDSSPTAALIDSVEAVVEGLVSFQRSIVDYGAERVELRSEKDGEEPVGEKRSAFPRIRVGELLRKNIEASVKAQREILELMDKQSKLAVKAADEFAHFSTAETFKSLATLAKESVENLITTQNHILTLASKQGKESLELLSKEEKGVLSKDLVKQAEKSIDSLHDTQKKLLDLAEELNQNAFKRFDSEESPEERHASKIAERISEGIDRLAKVQNDWLDATLKAMKRSA